MDFDSGDSADTSGLDDRRGAGGLRGGMLGAGAGGLGIVGVVIAIIASLAGGGGGGGGLGGLGDVLGSLNQASSSQTAGTPVSPVENTCEGATSTRDNPTFINCVRNNVDAFWTGVFADAGQTYRRPRFVLFTQAVQSGCGAASAATGPFYCPPDESVYMDLSFFDDLRSRFGATGGDFAQAYVVAHEYGHHLQNVLGIERQMRDLQARSPSKANEYSVRLELQADCFAGVWGNSAFETGKVAPGEVAQALDAAAAVGDDRIQKASGGRVNPESFTHGSSAQRQKWFNIGFESGNPDNCDTFGQAI